MGQSTFFWISIGHRSFVTINHSIEHKSLPILWLQITFLLHMLTAKLNSHVYCQQSTERNWFVKKFSVFLFARSIRTKPEVETKKFGGQQTWSEQERRNAKPTKQKHSNFVGQVGNENKHESMLKHFANKVPFNYDAISLCFRQFLTSLCSHISASTRISSNWNAVAFNVVVVAKSAICYAYHTLKWNWRDLRRDKWLS